MVSYICCHIPEGLEIIHRGNLSLLVCLCAPPLPSRIRSTARAIAAYINSVTMLTMHMVAHEPPIVAVY